MVPVVGNPRRYTGPSCWVVSWQGQREMLSDLARDSLVIYSISCSLGFREHSCAQSFPLVCGSIDATQTTTPSEKDVEHEVRLIRFLNISSTSD
uniref:Uncharacterized protein n=1 Tax=Ascaris lumbricoides TaxID=6252 RepID=A0A0M3HYS0_ASCLU